jgi:Zn-dependent protease
MSLNRKKVFDFSLLIVEFFLVLIISIFIHEFGHYLISIFLGVSSEMIFFDGLIIARTEILGSASSLKLAFIALGGPLINLLTFLVTYLLSKKLDFDIMFLNYFYRFNFFFFLFNLLPIPSFDGFKFIFYLLSYFA